MVSDDAMEPLERLLNLVGLLLASPTPLTFDQIRDTLEAYQGDNIESVKRKFERDKDSLRAYGVPLEMTGTDVWDVEMGYTIPKDRYYLPEISFTPEEITALYLAAQGGSEATEVAQGVRKLLYGAEGGLLTGSAGGPLAVGERHGPDAPDGRRRRGQRPSSRALRLPDRHRRARAIARSMRSASCSAVDIGTWSGTTAAATTSGRSGSPASRMRSPTWGRGPRRPTGFRAIDHVEAGPWNAGDASAPRRLRPRGGRARGGEPARRPSRERVRDDGWTVLSVPAAGRRDPRADRARLRAGGRGPGTADAARRGRAQAHGGDRWLSVAARASRVEERLARMLVVVPYLIQHPGTTLDEASTLFDDPGRRSSVATSRCSSSRACPRTARAT